MNIEFSRLVKDKLHLLLPYFSESETLGADSEIIGRFLIELMPVDKVGLGRMDKESHRICTEAAVWDAESGAQDSSLAARLQEHAGELLELAWQDEQRSVAGGEEINLLLGFPSNQTVLFQAVGYRDTLRGFLVLQRGGTGWTSAEKDAVVVLCSIMGAAFETRRSLETQRLSNFIFNKVLNSMKASIYITEVDTDKILFMNDAMKADFGLDSPEGRICWKVLQKNMTQRCHFCPKEKLQQTRAESEVVQWEEINTVTGRVYENYDSMIRWIDGRIVHLQQSIDMTELKSANTDELTKLISRRPGKKAMAATLQQARAEGKVVTVCMYDVNLLKDVNDRYGHAEGDRMIVSIADAMKGELLDGDYAFRLSGDEFVVIFYAGQKNIHLRMERVRKQLQQEQTPYEVGFCYGLVEVTPEHEIGVDEALFLSDQRMYEQKRRYHILDNERRRRERNIGSDSSDFQYDHSRLYDALIQSTDDYMYICNMKTGVFKYAQTMVDEFGLPGQVIENAASVWGAKVHKQDRSAFLEANQEIVDGHATSHCVEYRVQNRKGEWVWVRCRGHLELDENGEPLLFAGFITNLEKRNKIDHLTGLFNKLEFEDQITQMIETDPEGRFAVMILGMDDLKHINDLYNRIFGDEVIRIASQRIQTLLPSGASIFRLDGDEFGIIVRKGGSEALKKIYRTIHHCFENQQEYDGKKYYSTFSAGCLFYPQDANNYQDIIKHGGYSLEYAKTHGKKHCVFFADEILKHRARTLEMVEALRESIENDFEGFSLRFQPLVKAASGELMGAEALVRWTCKKFGDVSPVEFVPLLEQSGLIVPAGKWVFRAALRACKNWCQWKPDFVADVNLSYLQLQGSDFVPFMRDTLLEEQYLPQNLVVELTESYFAKENEQIQTIFAEIRQMGVRMAMDDFGTGYSALGILKESPVDIVKIDKTFIRDIRTSDFDATFIRFVVALCHSVSIQVCLEGVETMEDYEFVSQMGLDMIQGYLFGRPHSIEEFNKKYFEEQSAISIV